METKKRMMCSGKAVKSENENGSNVTRSAFGLVQIEFDNTKSMKNRGTFVMYPVHGMMGMLSIKSRQKLFLIEVGLWEIYLVYLLVAVGCEKGIVKVEYYEI